MQSKDPTKYQDLCIAPLRKAILNFNDFDCHVVMLSCCHVVMFSSSCSLNHNMMTKVAGIPGETYCNKLK